MRINVFCASEVGNKTEMAHMRGGKKKIFYCVSETIRSMIVGFIALGWPADTNKGILFLWWSFMLARLGSEIGLNYT